VNHFPDGLGFPSKWPGNSNYMVGKTSVAFAHLMAPQITKVIHKKKGIRDIEEGPTIQRLLQQVRYSKSNNHARMRLVQQETARGLFVWCCVISGKFVRQGYDQQDNINLNIKCPSKKKKKENDSALSWSNQLLSRPWRGKTQNQDIIRIVLIPLYN
jgi:hypothetical protein